VKTEDDQLRVLLVDDESDARMQIRRHLKLKMPEITILEAENGTDAIRIAREYSPRIVMIDINMPNMDGFTLIKQVQSELLRVQIVVFTGRKDSDAPIMALRLGVSDYLQKPLDMEELALALKRAIERSSILRRLDEYKEYLEQLVEERTNELLLANEQLRNEIEENKRLENQVRRSQKLDAVGVLAGGIAHDFNNILQAVIGYSELAMDDIAKGSEAEACISMVLSAAKRASELVRHILTFSRRHETCRVPVLAKPIVKETMQLTRASLPSFITIKQNLNAADAVIMADPVQLHQVLINLCTNAGQAMEESGGTLEVVLRTVNVGEDLIEPMPDLKPGRYVLFEIKDTGCGIEADIIDRVFEPFFTTREVEMGTGLGLAVVHGIVSGAGGDICVDSSPGVGTTFYVYWPLVEDEVIDENMEEGLSLPMGTEKILFVDDEDTLVELGKTMLSKLGYTVVGFTEGKDALEYFSMNPDFFDIVITDQAMPELTGMQLARRILKIRPRIPVIICTGLSPKVSQEDMDKVGIADYLEKPLSIRELVSSVRCILDKRSVT